MQVTETGSVRVDLVGGTLDLEPINLILPNVVTLNVATGLKAEVSISESNFDGVKINSLDYNTDYKFESKEITDENLYYNNTFKEMSFVLQILDLFDIRSNVELSLKSGAPAGSGLGGSSAMGVTLYKALTKFTKRPFETHDAVLKVKSIEGRILNRGVPGYQDYFPAAVGGVLALRGIPGKIDIEQLYCDELKSFLENHITLVYSGISRNSGINNWDVYKGFFDGDGEIKKSLSQIAEVSFKTYQCLKNKDYDSLLELIGKEGELRKSLAENIVPAEIVPWIESLTANGVIKGMKMCGAGGGGCFILVHEKESKEIIEREIQNTNFKTLDFVIERPL